MHLMFAAEAQNLAQNCTRQCLIDNKFQKYANIRRFANIATWLMQFYPYPQSSRFWGVFFTRGQFWPPGIVVACVCPSVRRSVRHQVCPRDNSSPVQARITKFGPKMQNTLVKVPIVLGGNRPWPSRSTLRSKSKFAPFWACPHRNSSPIQARITKFGPEMQNTLVKIPIVLGGNWPRPSRSNLT